MRFNSSGIRLMLFLAVAAILPACGKHGGGGAAPPAPAPVPDSVQFSAASYTVIEGVGSVTITVTRTGGAGAVTVNFATSDSTASAAGGDYTSKTGVLSWAAGDATPQTFTVTLRSPADGVATGDLLVNLALSLPGGGAILGAQGTAVIIIQDADGPVGGDGIFQFSASTYVANDAKYVVSEGQVTVQATITVTRTGGTVGAVTAAITVSPGTAVAGADYSVPVPNPVLLNWVDGDGAPKTFTLDILHNLASPAPPITVTMALSIPAQAGVPVVGRAGTATLTIIDNDVAGTVRFSSGAYSVFESGVAATITVNRINGSGGAASVEVNVTAGSAVAGTDYVVPTPNPVVLNWAAGDFADKTFTVSVIDNLIIDGTWTVNLALQNPVGIATSAPTAATLSILDDEPGTVVFSAPTYSIAEGNAGATLLSITVNRLGGSAGAASVDVADLLTGTATTGTDYVTFAATTLNWANGDSAPKSFNISIVGEIVVEPDETINLRLQNAVGVSIGALSTATATILNDDAPTAGQFEFDPAGVYTVSELTSSIVITIKRVNGSTGAVGVTVTTSDVTAKSKGKPVDRDYVANTQILAWASLDSSDRTFTVVINHNLYNEPTETFNVTLSLPTGGATLFGPNPKTVSITDGAP